MPNNENIKNITQLEIKHIVTDKIYLRYKSLIIFIKFSDNVSINWKNKKVYKIIVIQTKSIIIF